MCLLYHTFHKDRSGAEYELALSAWGEGVLREAGLLDMQKPDAILKEFKKQFRRDPRSVSLLIEDPRDAGFDHGFTDVDPAFLERFAALKELILPASVAQLTLTPALASILRENDTLIRGAFGSFAECFAAENGLHFRPADLIFAEYCLEPVRESTRLTLMYKRTGAVQIREEITSPGTSVSNTLGGSFYHPLLRDFFRTSSAEQIAARFPPALRDAILADGRLARFLAEARAHGYYTGRN